MNIFLRAIFIFMFLSNASLTYAASYDKFMTAGDEAFQKGQFSGAGILYKSALEALKKMAQSGDEKDLWSTTLIKLADSLREQDLYKQALERYEEAGKIGLTLTTTNEKIKELNTKLKKALVLDKHSIAEIGHIIAAREMKKNGGETVQDVGYYPYIITQKELKDFEEIFRVCEYDDPMTKNAKCDLNIENGRQRFEIWLSKITDKLINYKILPTELTSLGYTIAVYEKDASYRPDNFDPKRVNGFTLNIIIGGPFSYNFFVDNKKTSLAIASGSVFTTGPRADVRKADAGKNNPSITHGASAIQKKAFVVTLYKPAKDEQLERFDTAQKQFVKPRRKSADK